jgi:A1 cistron-splicing factor AAR2
VPGSFRVPPFSILVSAVRGSSHDFVTRRLFVPIDSTSFVEHRQTMVDVDAVSMNAIETTSQKRPGGVVALLQLPPGSVLGLDGQSVVLKRDDFVGFTCLPQDASFHLVTVRAGSIAKTPGVPSQQTASAVTAGFQLSLKESEALVRKYDPRTEEISSNPVDEVTTSNLLDEIGANRIGPQRIVPYDQLVPFSKADAWRDLTSFVSPQLLRKRGILTGAKIIPGAYGFDDSDVNKPQTNTSEPSAEEIDGKSVVYPRIPVRDSSQSARTHSRHLGTKHFMAELTPSERTSLFLNEHPSSRVMEHVLNSYYDDKWKDMLGDVQLSYVLFLNLHCFSSLEHWRDLVAMLSAIEFEGVSVRVELYSNFLSILSSQINTMERDFFDDVEMSGDNFLVPSMHRLISTLSRMDDEELKFSLTQLVTLLRDRFPNSFGDLEAAGDDTGEGAKDLMNVDSDDEDEDGPVVVSNEEVEASFARSSEFSQQMASPVTNPTYPESVRQQYPLLFAAVMPHEDVLMTCARALDNASDVSLVREAAAFLEQVETQK